MMCPIVLLGEQGLLSAKHPSPTGQNEALDTMKAPDRRGFTITTPSMGSWVKPSHCPFHPADYCEVRTHRRSTGKIMPGSITLPATRQRVIWWEVYLPVLTNWMQSP